MNAVLRWLYGDINRHELIKFVYISAAFFCASLATYLISVVRIMHQYKAGGGVYTTVQVMKMITPLACIFLVLICSKLADYYSQYRIITGVSFLYVITFGLFSYVLRVIESLNVGHAVKSIPGATLRLATTPDQFANRSFIQSVTGYLEIASSSFGVIIIALLWAFFTSTVSWQSAKRGLFFIVVGTSLGMYGAEHVLSLFGGSLSLIMALATAAILFIPLALSFEAHTLCGDRPECKAFEDVHYADRDKGSLSGLKQLFLSPYLVGILGLLVLAHLLQIIFSYSKFPEMLFGSQVVHELVRVGQYEMFGVLIFSLLALSVMIRKGSMTSCLVIYPATLLVLGLLATVAALMPALGWLFVASRIFATALFRPAVELLYIATGVGARFKSRLWIAVLDAFLVGPAMGKMLLQGSQTFDVGSLRLIVAVILILTVVGSFCMGSAFDKKIGHHRMTI